MNTAIPLPKRMRALAKDSRGYPVPYIVMRDLKGTPFFAINDSVRHLKTVLEKRCPICGNKLEKPYWFVGGPRSASDPRGCYLDSAMHHDCMTYALQVCPYLALPKYLGRVDAARVDPAALPGGLGIFLDTTQIPERPKLFVAVAARSFTTTPGTMPGSLYLWPARPYEAVEYWQHGRRLTETEAKEALI
jgi:hypothetical protein